MCTVNLSPGFPQRDLQPITRVTEHWEKGNNQTFCGLLDIGSELKIISKDPKCHCGLSVIAGANGGWVIYEVLAQVHLTVDPVGHQTHLVVISRIPNWNRHTQQLAEFHLGSRPVE